MDAVGREELVVLISVDNIHTIALFITRRIWLLYRATRRREVLCYGQTHSRTISKWNLRLDKALTKTSAADDCSAVVILKCTRQNLARRGATLINKNRDIEICGATTTVTKLTHALFIPILCVDNKLSALKELVCDMYCLIKKTARISTKVENKALHALLAEGIYRTLYLAM